MRVVPSSILELQKQAIAENCLAFFGGKTFTERLDLMTFDSYCRQLHTSHCIISVSNKFGFCKCRVSEKGFDPHLLSMHGKKNGH